MSKATLGLVGDVMLGRHVSRAIPSHAPAWFWGDVLPKMTAADAVIANLECPITRHPKPWREGVKTFRFKADPAAAALLKAANVRLVTLANNHTLDYQARGLLDTLAHLDAAGIASVGGGADSAAAAAPALLKLGDVTLGVVGATDNMPEFAAQATLPGTSYMKIRDDAETLARIAATAKRLRAQGADLLLLSLHWGPNMRLKPSRRFQRFARAVIERGVDIVHGHSAHVFQAIERHGCGIVLYDCGNFLDDYWKFPFRRTLWSFLFLLEIEERRLARLRLVPTHLQGPPVRLATGALFEQI
ncbi:MAG: CapA family protein, partial [Burkholderiales bacterium]